MENIQDLKKQLRHGDYQLLSEISTVPAETVKSILNGSRNPNTPRGRQVLAAAEKLVESRKQLWSNASTSEPGDIPSKVCA